MSNTPVCPCAPLGGDELDRAQRAGHEQLARRRAMHDLDALAVAREHDRVLAHDVAAAQRREADRARLALAGDAVARVDARSPRARGPMPAAAASPRRSAVPEGASTLCL